MEILKMTKRLYFTCPIKAMYMNHYFGVKFMPPANSNNCEVHELAQETIMYLREDCEDCMENWKKQLDEAGKFFVAPESEHIFKLQKEDLVNYKSRSGKNKITATYLESFVVYESILKWKFQILKWKLQSQGMNSPKIYKIDAREFLIIMRDKKQFFTPEVENER